MLRLVIPKGSLEEQTLTLLEAADLRVRRGSSRDYHGSIDDDRIERVSLMRPQEIPQYVEEGFFDVGITGQDWLAETGARVTVLATLRYAKGGPGRPARLVLAVPVESPVTGAADLPHGSRISTEYPEITRRFFEDHGVAVKVFPSYGATEAKVPEIVDAIVDVAETGGTLRAHGMKVVETLMESDVVLIANAEAAADGEKRRGMDDLTTLIVGAMEAQGRVMLKLNVSEERLKEVLEHLPAMKAPTVSPLAEEGNYAVETIVEKSEVNTLIPVLKQHGATDIVELAVSKIVP
ncbi:MAG: ATP phosphoribosyltransferase [Actinomycetota bacterium]